MSNEESPTPPQQAREADSNPYVKGTLPHKYWDEGHHHAQFTASQQGGSGEEKPPLHKKHDLGIMTADRFRSLWQNPDHWTDPLNRQEILFDLQKLTQDQSGISFRDLDDLKAENEKLKSEIASLKANTGMEWVDPMDREPKNYPVAFKGNPDPRYPDSYFYGQASEYKDLYDRLKYSVRWLVESTPVAESNSEEEKRNNIKDMTKKYSPSYNSVPTNMEDYKAQKLWEWQIDRIGVDPIPFYFNVGFDEGYKYAHPEIKEKQEVENNGWPFVDTTNSEAAEAASNRSPKFQKIVDNKFQPPSEGKEWTDIEVSEFLKWVHSERWHFIESGNWGHDYRTFSGFPIFTTTLKLLDEYKLKAKL